LESLPAVTSCKGGFNLEEVDEWVRAGKAAEEVKDGQL
jgi:hypothetical protein